MNKGSRHIAGQGIQIACCSCGKDHPDGPFRTQTLMFESMAAHGWSKGPDTCAACSDALWKAEAAGLVSFRKDAWDDVEEIEPGVWVEKAPLAVPAGRAPGKTRRWRRIRRLL